MNVSVRLDVSLQGRVWRQTLLLGFVTGVSLKQYSALLNINVLYRENKNTRY